MKVLNLRSLATLRAVLFGSLVLVMLPGAGCGRNKVSTSELRDSFESAEPALRSLSDKAVSDIKTGNYPQALADLQQLGHKAKLTPDQLQAVKDTLAAVQTHLTNTAAQAAPGPQPPQPDWLKGLPH